MTITPIIVVGMNRSGTKWLSNILANHPQVACVQHENYSGILETNMFDVMPSKFQLEYADDYVGFVELWSQSDFFRLTGINKSRFLAYRPGEKNTFQLFAELMEVYAAQQHKEYWLQKTSPLCVDAVAQHYPRARFVIIRRALAETLDSTKAMAEDQGQANSRSSLVRQYVLQDKLLTSFERRHRCPAIWYHQLKEHPRATIEHICRALGLEYQEAMLETRFEKNSSFADAQRQARMQTPPHWSIRLWSCAWRAVPLPALKAASWLRRSLRPPLPTPFVAGTFATLKRQISSESAKSIPFDSARAAGQPEDRRPDDTEDKEVLHECADPRRD